MTNRFHRYLNLPFEIVKPDFCNYEPSDFYQKIHDYTNVYVSMLHHELGLITKHVDLIYTEPGGKVPVHVDGPELDDHVKINKTWGPKEGVIRWWSPKEYFTHQLDNSYNQTLVAREEDSEFLYEVNTNHTSLINVGKFHSTYNPTNQGRWTLSFIPGKKNTNENVSWDEALEIYKDYIVEK